MFDFVVSIVEQSGYFGIALLMFAENVFPPIPSELIMPLAGFVAARGDLNPVGIVLAGSVGSLAGAVFWYQIGRMLGAARLKRWAAKHGRWLTLAPAEIEQSQDWFKRHGAMAVFFGRLLPAVRTLISVPAGVAGMRWTPFLLYSCAGTVLWTTLLAAAGYVLEGQYKVVGDYVNPVSNVVVVVLVAWYIYRVVTFKRKHASS